MSDTNDKADYVSVPKALLEEVLDNAMSDSHSTQAEFSCSSEDDADYQAQRDKIRELMSLAGIEDGGVVGRGFFGLVNALAENKEKKDDPAQGG